MPFSGGTYTKARDFTTDAANGVNPTAANFDEVIDDIQTALTATLLRDGSVAMTGGLDLGSHALSGVTTLSASSSAAITGDLAVNTNKFTVNAASGNVVVAGTLGVSGAVTASSTVGVTGDFAVNTNKFTVNSSSGNVVAAGEINGVNPLFWIDYSANNLTAQSVTSGTYYAMNNVTNAAAITTGNIGAFTVVNTTGATNADFYVQAPTSGVYRIRVLTNSFYSSAVNQEVVIALNGSITSARVVTGHTVKATTWGVPSAGAYLGQVAECIVTLATTDKVRVLYTCGSGTTPTITGGIRHFSVEKLGRG